MKNRIFNIGVALTLLLSLCLVTAIQVTAATNWYVATTGSDTTGDGSFGNPWGTIQGAIDNVGVHTGDTIIVAGGTYPETVNVTESVKIKAQSGETATVTPDSGNDGFYITADDVIVEGFTVTGAYTGIYLDSVSGCTINGSIGVSIALMFANTCIIQGNTCSDDTTYRIFVYYSEGNLLLNNTCHGDYAIYLEDSARNNISGNTCEYGDYGIYLLRSIDNVFVANICTCYENGYGIFITPDSSNEFYSRNTFIFNTIDDNQYGVFFNVPGIDPSLVYFKNNNVTNNYTGIQYVDDNFTYMMDAGQNYWASNYNDVIGSVNCGDRLSSPVLYSMTEIESWVTIITTTSIETETTTVTTSLTTTSKDTTVVTRVVVSTVVDGTVTLLKPTTVTETQSVTSTNTQTNTSTQFITSTDTQSLTVTVSVPQTVNHTTTTTLIATEEALDWPLIIIISVAGLLAGGLVVTTIIRRV
jgi:parallel beta-helix repeat protein